MTYQEIRQASIARAEGYFKRMWAGESTTAIAKSENKTPSAIFLSLRGAKLPTSMHEIKRLKSGG